MPPKNCFAIGRRWPPGQFAADGLHQITGAAVYGAGHIAAKLAAKLIVVVSHSGATALALSKQRNYVYTVGISDSETTLRQMCLYWGVHSLAGRPDGQQHRTAGLRQQMGPGHPARGQRGPHRAGGRRGAGDRVAQSGACPPS